ncbi:hypothetical protein G4O51_08750 [Candidatus Bathyarchaeota archaeon A05DMB-2]|jgi:hypothetical protein|nr:hypothetical protein [Candidatus Bathyarchaeota archaeon A05DMB-2]
MKLEEAKTAADTLTELAKTGTDFSNTIKGMSREVKMTKKLWREGNKSRLIKIGVALIMFPEPTPISETIGACFVAAGAVQKGIQNRAIFIEDIKKTFQSTLKEVYAAKHNLSI